MPTGYNNNQRPAGVKRAMPGVDNSTKTILVLLTITVNVP